MRAFLSLLLLLSLTAAPLLAEEKKVDALPPVTPAPAAEPDISAIPFMQNLRNIGASIYYLGNQTGLDGWFVVKDKEVQILYTTADKKSVLVGALLSADGANISQQQVTALASANPQVEKIIKGTASAGVSAPSGAPSVSVPAGASPSETLYGELQKTASVTFGKAEAPGLLMIMDVNCHFCHETWKQLQPLVEAGQLRVTMIPIGALGRASELEAANWLASADPYAAWKQHVGGDEAIFKTGSGDAARQEAVASNTALIRKWKVDQTPYILYRGANGKVRLIVGQPRDVNQIVSDIAK